MGIRVQSEEQFLHLVIEAAVLFGWGVYHTRDSRGSHAGFPDLVLVKDGKILFAELKVGSNKPTAPQRKWLDRLADVAKAAPGAVRVYLWKPEDWKTIESVLAGES